MSLHKLPASVNELEKTQVQQSTQTQDEDVPPESDTSSSTGDDDDENWDDWVSESENKKSYMSLFDSSSLPSVEAVLKYDKEKFGVDLEEISKKLDLDFHRRARLINYIRKENPKPQDVLVLNGSEDLFSKDEYLIPVVENDPLLQVGSDDWSDSESESPAKDKDDVIRALKRKLDQAKQDLADFRAFVDKQLRTSEVTRSLDDSKEGSSAEQPKRDDDSHYFESYGMNGMYLNVFHS